MSPMSGEPQAGSPRWEHEGDVVNVGDRDGTAGFDTALCDQLRHGVFARYRTDDGYEYRHKANLGMVNRAVPR